MPAVAFLLFLSAACNLSREGIVVRMEPEEIQKRLEAGFPIEKTYLMVLKLTLKDPEIIPAGEPDRIGLRLKAAINVSVGGEPIAGTAAVSSGMRYDRDRRAFFLEDPRLEEMDIPALPGEYRREVRAAAEIAVIRLLTDYEVYALDQSDRAQAMAGMMLKKVEIRGGGVEATFGP
jgi:hypothetical protein